MFTLKNRVQLIGNMGNAPEIKTTENGKKLARFSIATNDHYTNAQGEKIAETIWHNILAWGKLAEIAEQFLSRGADVAIEGKLINRSYTDREGVKKYITEIQASEILFLRSKEK